MHGLLLSLSLAFVHPFMIYMTGLNMHKMCKYHDNKFMHIHFHQQNICKQAVVGDAIEDDRCGVPGKMGYGRKIYNKFFAATLSIFHDHFYIWIESCLKWYTSGNHRCHAYYKIVISSTLGPLIILD